MIVVNLPKSEAYQSLYDLSGYSVDDSLIITNDTPGTIFLTQSDTQPIDDSNAFFAHPYNTVLAHADGKPLWVRGRAGPVVVQKLSSTVTPFTSIEFPHDTMTSKREGFRRLRVDVGQTGFFEGREARTFKELNIAAGARYVIEITLPTNVILYEVNLSLDAGSVRLSTITNGTSTGTFNEILPVIPKNTMTTRPAPYHVFQTVLKAGGDVTGGTVIDIARIISSGATSKQATVGGVVSGERGVAPGLYHWVFDNISNSPATGVFSCFFEERLQ